jgi:2-methylisoborneol synthase
MSIHQADQAIAPTWADGDGQWPRYEMRSWGNGAAPPLYCPVTSSEDESSAKEIDERLVAWADSVGFSNDYLDKLGSARFGRLMALAFTDHDDLDRLFLAGQMHIALWAADDYYADDSAMGASQEELPARLVFATAAMEALVHPRPYAQGLEETLKGDPVLAALRSSTQRMRRLASPEQVARVCAATYAMFIAWAGYVPWRSKGAFPPAFHYLAMRQLDSFYPSLTLVDVVGGYEVPPNLFYDPQVQQLSRQVGMASIIVNDLYSVAKDAADVRPVCNLVLILAAEQGCSLQDAVAQVVQLHNDIVRECEASCRALANVSSAELQRYLRGLQQWMAGALTWHDTSLRYKHPLS